MIALQTAANDLDDKLHDADVVEHGHQCREER